MLPREVFTNFSQYKNVNIANFVLAVPLERNWMNEFCNLEMYCCDTHWYLISHLQTSYGTNKKENFKYMAIQSWQYGQHCHFCVFVKTSKRSVHCPTRDKYQGMYNRYIPPLQIPNKASHPGIETQKRHYKVQNRGISDPIKWLMSPIFWKKIELV